MKKILLFTSIIFLFVSCSEKKDLSEFLLLADQEAPLGWVYLRVYKDEKFEYISHSLKRSDKEIHQETVDFKNDIIYFDCSG